MPGELAAAAITAGAGLLGTGINAYTTTQTNNAQLSYNERMYGRQRGDSLTDWYRMNEYNSPEAQMRRLREAGLNPNLVYGQGAVANSATPIRQTTPQNYSPQPIRVDLSSIGESINMYNELKTRTLQNSNLQKQNELLEQQTNLTKAKTAVELSKEGYFPSITDLTKEKKWLTTAQMNHLGTVDYQMTQTLPLTLDQMRENIAKLKATIAKETAQTNEINTLLPSKLQNNLQDLLLKKSATAKNTAELQRIGASIVQLLNLSSETTIKAGAKFFGLDFGTYGSSKGMMYDQQKKLDKVMETIIPDWNKKTPAQKALIYNNLNQ